jgi:hypothetical protein
MEWREITSQERALLDVLLSTPFSGREAIVQQLHGARVRIIDAEGSLAFDVASPEPATVKHRIPIEAEAEDLDGVTVHMLLHLVEGKVSELEFYKDDSSRVLRLPLPDRWRVIQLHG